MIIDLEKYLWDKSAWIGFPPRPCCQHRRKELKAMIVRCAKLAETSKGYPTDVSKAIRTLAKGIK